MKHEIRHNEVATLYEKIELLISVMRPTDLPSMVEMVGQNTASVCRIKSTRSVTKNETTELIDIEFIDNTIITLHLINGDWKVDVAYPSTSKI